MVSSSSNIPCPPFDNISPASMLKRTVCKKRPLRKVGFADARTYRITLLENLSPNERANTWYTSHDYAIFGKEVKAAVKRMRRGETTACNRGLEKYQSSSIHSDKKKRELSHYRSILAEQQRQKQSGIPNPKVLRMLSMINSKRAMQNALELAQNDARDVLHATIEKAEVQPLQLSNECSFGMVEASDSDSESSITVDTSFDGFGKFHPI